MKSPSDRHGTQNGRLLNCRRRRQKEIAMESFCIRLKARHPAQGRFRAYRIEAGIDPLADWVVNVTYGRMGTRRRHIRQLASDEPQARRIVRQSLKRRATAPRRIRVGYQLRELADPGQWLPFRSSRLASLDSFHRIPRPGSGQASSDT